MNDIREKAEAVLLAYKVGYETMQGMSFLETPMQALKKALKPSREEIADYLTDYNKWRRGGDNEMPEPKELGYYIECAIEELRKDESNI